MVSKTKTKARKKGKQTRGTKKLKPAKKKGAKKTSTRLAHAKKVATRAKRSNTAQRSRIPNAPEQQSQPLQKDDVPSVLPSVEGAGSNESKVESMPSDTIREDETTYQSSDTQENPEDYNAGRSEMV